MTRVPIHNIGSVGVLKDTPSHLLPPEAWSEARNVDFNDSKVRKSSGFALIYDPPTVTPYWAMPVFTGSSRVWVYAGLGKVYTISGGVHTDITRAAGDYIGTDINRWQGGILGGIPVINNGVDAPQSWSPQSPAQRLVNLPNWPANTTANVIRPFKNYLVALDVTKSGVRSPHRVKWSDAADPGTVPASWDETDPTVDAGEVDLGDTNQGPLIDQLTLGDINVIYKEDSVWGMQFIGGTFIFRFFQLFPENIGSIAKNGIGSVPAKATHFVGTSDDIIIHDGRVPRSVLTRRLRKWFNNTLSSIHFSRSFVTVNRQLEQMWFCFVEEGATWPNLALTWNWTDGSLSVRDLTNASFIALGPTPDLDADVWDSDNEVWDSDFTTWDFSIGRAIDRLMLQTDPVNNKLYLLNTTNQFNGQNMSAFVERTGLAIIGQDREGNPKVDLGKRKLITRIWPKLRGGPIEVSLGAQEKIDGAIRWVGPVSYNPAIDPHVDIINEGLLMAVKFESNANVFWELDGYDIDVAVIGDF